MRNDDPDFDDLTAPERIRRVQDLWDRIADEGEIEITAEQREELERRLRKHDASPDAYTSWQELRLRLEPKER